MKGLCRVFRNVMAYVSGRRYDSILQRVWSTINQGGTAECNFVLDNTFIVLSGTFLFFIFHLKDFHRRKLYALNKTMANLIVFIYKKRIRV